MKARLLYGTPGTKRESRARFRPLRVRNPATMPGGGLQSIDVLQIDVDRKARLELLTPTACARILDCSESRVLQLIRSGRIEARRVGRQYLVLDEILEEFVARERRQLENLEYRAPDR